MGGQHHRNRGNRWITVTLAVAALLTWGLSQAADALPMLPMAPIDDAGGFEKFSPGVTSMAETAPWEPLNLIVIYAEPPTDAEIGRLSELNGSVSAVLNDVDGISGTALLVRFLKSA